MSAPQNEWIQWEGGECPVDPKTRVFVRFRNGEDDADEALCGPPSPASAWLWQHEDTLGDIIAYRVVSE